MVAGGVVVAAPATKQALSTPGNGSCPKNVLEQEAEPVTDFWTQLEPAPYCTVVALATEKLSFSPARRVPEAGAVAAGGVVVVAAPATKQALSTPGNGSCPKKVLEQEAEPVTVFWTQLELAPYCTVVALATEKLSFSPARRVPDVAAAGVPDCVKQAFTMPGAGSPPKAELVQDIVPDTVFWIQLSLTPYCTTVVPVTEKDLPSSATLPQLLSSFWTAPDRSLPVAALVVAAGVAPSALAPERPALPVPPPPHAVKTAAKVRYVSFFTTFTCVYSCCHYFLSHGSK